MKCYTKGRLLNLLSRESCFYGCVWQMSVEMYLEVVYGVDVMIWLWLDDDVLLYASRWLSVCFILLREYDFFVLKCYDSINMSDNCFNYILGILIYDGC